jgi:hypothetical protein
MPQYVSNLLPGTPAAQPPAQQQHPTDFLAAITLHIPDKGAQMWTQCPTTRTSSPTEGCRPSGPAHGRAAPLHRALWDRFLRRTPFAPQTVRRRPPGWAKTAADKAVEAQTGA